ncbi:MAG: hypothetical protein AAF724_09115 [Pseudomonadota bacterium]
MAEGLQSPSTGMVNGGLKNAMIVAEQAKMMKWHSSAIVRWTGRCFGHPIDRRNIDGRQGELIFRP